MVVVSHAHLGGRPPAVAVSLLAATTAGQLDADRAPRPPLISRKGITKGATALISRPRFDGEMVVIRLAAIAGLTFVIARRPIF